MRRASALMPSRFMNHAPSPTIEFARDSKRVGGVLCLPGLADEMRDGLRRDVSPTLTIEKLIKDVFSCVRRHADDARDAASNRLGVARHDTMFAADHRDQSRGIVRESLLAERQGATVFSRRAKANRRVHRHEQRGEKSTQRRAKKRGLEDETQEVRRAPVPAERQIEDNRAVSRADTIDD